MKHITQELIEKFKDHLVNEEKSKATVEKYLRDISAFLAWLSGQAVNKTTVLLYKNFLIEKYKPASVNSMLSSVNAFFTYNEWCDCRVKSLKIQKQIFASNDKELSKEEYDRLLDAARSKNSKRLYLLMQTICSTGIRVSELKFITVAAVSSGVAEIRCKSKFRQVFLPKKLCEYLRTILGTEKLKAVLFSFQKTANRLTDQIFGQT